MKLMKKSLMFFAFFILFVSFHSVFPGSFGIYSSSEENSQSYFESFINWLYFDTSYKKQAGNRFLTQRDLNHNEWLENLPTYEEKVAHDKSLVVYDPKFLNVLRANARGKNSLSSIQNMPFFIHLQKLQKENNSKDSSKLSEIEELD